MLPALPTDESQMVRTFSVPQQITEEEAGGMELIAPAAPAAAAAVEAPQTAPLSRRKPTKTTGMEQTMAATTSALTMRQPMPQQKDGGERARAIASLLSEMEGIRMADTNTFGHINASSSSDANIMAGPSTSNGIATTAAAEMPISRRIPVPPPPPPLHSRPQSPLHSAGQRLLQFAHRLTADSDNDHDDGDGDELGRMQGSALGMPRRKRFVLYAVTISFCVFLVTYVLLVLSILFGWL